MIRLDTFRRHCDEMAVAEHKPDCPSITAKEPYWPMWAPIDDDGNWAERSGKPMVGLGWLGPKPKWEPPKCDGCNSEDERALFAQMAREVVNYQQGEL